MACYLIDTCIWRDFYEDRHSRTGRPLGRYASEFFMKIIQDKDTIIYSEILIRELRKRYDDTEIEDMLAIFDVMGLLVKTEITKDVYTEAKTISRKRGLPLNDCIQAVQARNSNAVLVSQDAHLLKDLSDITECVRPESI